jgi:hypothetical protein
VKEIRGIDYNQVQIGQILQPFLQAQQNGLLAQKATGAFNATYNPNIAGSQPLPFFNALPSGGLLTNATVSTDIQTGQVGELASLYQSNGLNGPYNFFTNPNTFGAKFAAKFLQQQLSCRRRGSYPRYSQWIRRGFPCGLFVCSLSV